MTNTHTNTNTATLTAYQLAKAANKELAERGFKAIPPQMIYTYVKKGYIPSIEVDFQVRIEAEVAAMWIEWYVGKRTAGK